MHDPRGGIAGLEGRLPDLLPDTLALYDTEGGLLDLHRPAAASGLSATDDLQPTDEELKDLPLLYRARFRTAQETRHPDQFIHRTVTAGGKTLYYEIYLTPASGDRLLAAVRRIAEQTVARIESEHLHRFFTEVLENIAIPVSVKSAETGRYIYWSRKAELFGRTPGEMTGCTEDLYMPPAQARIVQQIGRELAEGKRERYEGIEKYVANDGKEHTFTITRTPFTFGEEKLILCSALDISELKETQTSLLHTKDELARKNMTLSSVLDLAKVIPWGCDLGRRIFYCDYHAYHPDDAPGPDAEGHYIIPMERYFAGIHPSHRQEAIRLIDELVAGTRDELHETYLAHWFNQHEWEWVQVQSSVSCRAADGRPLHLIGSAQRITEQKTTEQALLEAKENLAMQNIMLSSVLSIAQVVPWSADPETGLFACDYDTYHHESASGPDAEGRYTVPFEALFSRIHPDYRTAAFDHFTDLLEGRTTTYHAIYPIHWYNDREYEWVETQTTLPGRSPEGRTLPLIGSARLITAQKRMEESLRQAKEQAERSNTLKSAFLANMSHEIRTPLNAIVGFSELLAQTEDEAEKQEYITIIQNSNALLLQLIGDILDLSKIEAGTLAFTFADYDLNALMEELEQTARMKITDPAVEVACTHRIPGTTIHTDRGRLLQVLHNFINNAAKFTERGHIHFGYRRHSDGRWYFYVEDTGCGIPREKIGDVFERFVKLDEKAKGTGLGLAISKSIIERLGGQIGVFSAPGQGSTFWFMLPAGCITTASACGPIPEEDVLLPVQKETSSSTAILVAEDDAANYKLFEAMLKKHYTVLHAWNGREAVEMFREHRPGLILMDIKMPEMDGYEATAAIRQLSPDVPIVAVTAFAYPEDMRRILANGFNGCLPKPVNAENLKKKIAEFCIGGKEPQ